MRPSRPDNPGFHDRAAFTLVELIIVMVILAVGAAFVAPHVNSFFRGRVLSSEARRMLSLVHYGQSRAVAEGVPVVLWFNPREATYGLSVQPGYTDGDDRASSFALNPALALELPQNAGEPQSELGDEKLGLTEGLAVIRFLPGGYPDEISVPKIIIHDDDTALELSATDDHLSYEILPVTPG